MSARSRRTFLNFPPRLVRCCSRKQDPSPPEPSMSRPPTRTSRSPAPSSACSCCGACACPYRSRRADVPAMGSLIPWAIIVPPAPPPRSCRRAPCPCREAGARVARNVRLADRNLDVPVADAPSRGRARPTPALMRSPAAQSMRLHTPLPPGRPVVRRLRRFGCTGTSCTSRTQIGVWKKKTVYPALPNFGARLKEIPGAELGGLAGKELRHAQPAMSDPRKGTGTPGWLTSMPVRCA